MKKHHLFAFYSTLLVPIGALAGIWTGTALQAPVLLTVAGVISGFAASYLLVRRNGPANTP